MARRERFPISYDTWYEVLSRVLFLGPDSAYIEVGPDEVEVRMGWAFSARFRPSAVDLATLYHGQPFSRGVHGFAGRWLVNGAGLPIVSIKLVPEQKARVLGFPVRLNELLVSVAEPDALLQALTALPPISARPPRSGADARPN